MTSRVVQFVIHGKKVAQEVMRGTYKAPKYVLSQALLCIARRWITSEFRLSEFMQACRRAATLKCSALKNMRETLGSHG